MASSPLPVELEGTAGEALEEEEDRTADGADEEEMDDERAAAAVELAMEDDAAEDETLDEADELIELEDEAETPAPPPDGPVDELESAVPGFWTTAGAISGHCSNRGNLRYVGGTMSGAGGAFGCFHEKYGSSGTRSGTSK